MEVLILVNRKESQIMHARYGVNNEIVGQCDRTYRK
jgi:hypothetical protein